MFNLIHSCLQICSEGVSQFWRRIVHKIGFEIARRLRRFCNSAEAQRATRNEREATVGSLLVTSNAPRRRSNSAHLNEVRLAPLGKGKWRQDGPCFAWPCQARRGGFSHG